jgi:transposase-like protein
VKVRQQGRIVSVAAIAKVLHASWQRCRVYFMRNVLAHAGRNGRRVVVAFIATAFAQDDAAAAKTQWRQVADQLRPKVPKLAAMMDDAEADVLAHMAFPKDHRTKLHSTNPLERLNGEIRPGLRWADLLRRVYDIDMRTCPNCGLGTLEPIATILDPDAIARILDAIGRRSRAPPP